MRFSYHWLKELVRSKESPEKMAELLALHSFEATVAGRVGTDWAIEARIPTNRISDAASHWGLARELAAIKNSKFSGFASARPRTNKNQNSKPIERKPRETEEVFSVTVKNPRLCPRYTAHAVAIRSMRSSPAWMQRRLIACGFRPLNAVVDITNYVMLELGQPLHAFDLDAIRGRAMTVRESRAGETVTTLDGTRHALPKGALVIQDRERLIDLAGIMGGENSAVSPHTRRIVLQAATFDPVAIYRTTRALGFTSEAAKIYVAGVDPNRTAPALQRAIQLLGDIAGAELIGRRIDIYPRTVTPRTLLLRNDYARRIIGEDISPRFYERLWKRLGFEARPDRNGWRVEIPTARRDIRIEEDLIEEVARIFGYGKIRALPPETRLAPSVRNEALEWENRIKDMLVGAGFAEIYAYRFIGQGILEAFASSPHELIELENPMNPETHYLGAHPAHRFVQLAAENLRHAERASVFGLTTGFRRARKPTLQTPTNEQKYLVVSKAMREAGTTKTAKGGETFYEVKGVLDRLFETLGVSDQWYDDALTVAERREAKALHPYRTAKVMVGGEYLGVIAELHPETQRRLKAKGRIVFAEILFEKLWRIARAETEFTPIGKYPAVVRDIAIIVPENVKADDVEGVIQNAGGPLLADSDLFDYFQDAAMTKSDEKSLAFHLVFQSPERTLTDGGVSRLFKKIVQALKAKDWEVRG